MLPSGIAYYETRNTEQRNTEQRNTPEQWRNNWTLPGTLAEHPGTTKSYKTKNNYSAFKRKFKTQNLNFQLKVKTLFIADINYLFIYFSLFKAGSRS